jgi:hypothetical protein
MAIQIKHAFQSAKSDGADPTLIQPSYWNAALNFTMATARLVGRSTAGSGAAEEISIGTGLSLSGGVLTNTVSATASTTNAADLTSGTLAAARLPNSLSSIYALTPAADRLPYYTAASTAALATFTSFARTLLDDTDAATMRTTLGLAAGATAALASQAEAEAGSNNTALMTPLRTAQAIDAQVLITASYTSSDQTVTAAGSLTLAHSLGVKPKLVRYYLKFAVAAGGYSIGDEVDLQSGNQFVASSDRSYGFVAWDDTTNINIRFGSEATSTFVVLNKTTGTQVAIANTSVRLVVRAYA